MSSLAIVKITETPSFQDMLIRTGCTLSGVDEDEHGLIGIRAIPTGGLGFCLADVNPDTVRTSNDFYAPPHFGAISEFGPDHYKVWELGHARKFVGVFSIRSKRLIVPIEYDTISSNSDYSLCIGLKGDSVKKRVFVLSLQTEQEILEPTEFSSF